MRRGNRGFAKHALAFVNRTRIGDLPGFPLLWIGCGAAALLMVITEAFGTGVLPLGRRAAFWVLLMAWNALKWQVLFALLVRRPSDWWRAALIGSVLLNLPLPLEIMLCGRAVGMPFAVDMLSTWGRALAISLGICAVGALVGWVLVRRAATRLVAPSPAGDGILARARIAPEALAAIEAEDHYCRVRDREGRSALLHYRFADALAEVAAIDGMRVHRGAWVAAAAVAGARRDGRRWRLLLADGHEVAVSATYVAEARARHWLRPAPVAIVR